MTRSQRRIRARRTGQLPAECRTVAAGLSLVENPNRGKRHAARLDGAPLEWLAAAVARDENRATLVNHERYRRTDGRRLPDRRELDGSPSPASYVATYGPKRHWTPNL